MPPILKSRVTPPACTILVFMSMMPKSLRNGSESFIRKALPKPGQREQATRKLAVRIRMATCLISLPGDGVKNCCPKKRAVLALEILILFNCSRFNRSKYSSKTSHTRLGRRSEDDDRVRPPRRRQSLPNSRPQENCRVDSEGARAKPGRTQCGSGGRSGNAPAQRQVPQEKQDHRRTFISG